MPLIRFFSRPAHCVAKNLVGAELVFDGVGGIITEVEAYEPDDPASHSYRGKTSRNQAMFGPAGCAYIYRSYGLHWCLNFVCLPGSAVLIRALEPRWGINVMERRRGVSDLRRLCTGPGRLSQALAIDGSINGVPLDMPPFNLTLQEPQAAVIAGTRIGITRGTDKPWRFGLSGSAFLSTRF